MKLITTIAFAEACSFVNKYHRHLRAPQGHKKSFALWIDNVLRGVIMIGRPTGRRLDNGVTLEITRCCTDGYPNACSMLMGYACRWARLMRYEKVITFILQTENGASIKAAGFTLEAEDCGGTGTGWNSRTGRQKQAAIKKKRFFKMLKK